MQIAEIGKEWFIIEGIEIVVANRLVSQVKDKMETLVVPVLADHGDFIAGRVGKKDDSKPQAKAGIVNVAVSNCAGYARESIRPQSDHATRCPTIS